MNFEEIIKSLFFSKILISMDIYYIIFMYFENELIKNVEGDNFRETLNTLDQWINSNAMICLSFELIVFKKRLDQLEGLK